MEDEKIQDSRFFIRWKATSFKITIRKTLHKKNGIVKIMKMHIRKIFDAYLEEHDFFLHIS